MIGMALPEAWASGLLSQERSQASSTEPVQFDEQAWSGMLEVSEPASDHWIEVFDDTAQAVAPSSAGLGPDLVLERLHALAPHEPPAVFEPVSQEIENLAGLPAVRDMRIVGVLRQAVLGDPGSHPVERRPCVRLVPAENDKVVRVADHPVIAGLHRLIQRVQVQVAQQGRDDSPNAKDNLGTQAMIGRAWCPRPRLHRPDHGGSGSSGGW